MAVEQERRCGFRKVGGLYLEGEYIAVPCDRLPLLLETCPVCGGGIKVGRGFTEINPLQLWGLHTPCDDAHRPCFVCDPEDEPAYIMLVGEGYYPTPRDFIQEATHQGISKRIPFVPKRLKVGQTVIYLAHAKASEVRSTPELQNALAIGSDDELEYNPRLLEAETVRQAPGIFGAFIPQRIVQIVKESQLKGAAGEKMMEDLTKRGITPVPVPDDDPDHAGRGHTHNDDDD